MRNSDVSLVKYKTIEFEVMDQVGTIWLNRPQVHNAFDEIMISELLECLDNIQNTGFDKFRVVVIRGRGKSFCAGADLNWMGKIQNYSSQENIEVNENICQCYKAIYKCKFPTVALVHGAAIGGANGLLAACDFALCHKKTLFCFSEVKMGLVPACISPYVIKRIGEFPARELMLSGMRFRGKKAHQLGLVNDSLNTKRMEIVLDDLCNSLKEGGPNAIAQCKELICKVTNSISFDESVSYTARLLTDIFRSHEGREGVSALLQKRDPQWMSSDKG